MARLNNFTPARRKKKNQRKNAAATAAHQHQHQWRKRMMLCLGGVVLVLVWVQMMSGSGSGSGERNFKSLFPQQLMILDTVVQKVQVQKKLPPNHHNNNKTIVIAANDTSSSSSSSSPTPLVATDSSTTVADSGSGLRGSSSKQEQDHTAVDDHVTVVLPNPSGSPGMECEQTQWLGKAETDTACYHRVRANQNCGKRYMTYNTMKQGCACYPTNMAVCTLRSASGRISWDMTISKEYLLTKDQHSSTVTQTTRNSTSAWPNSTQFWKDYRLGDYVLSKGKTIHGFARTYQGTLAADYLDALNQKRTDGKTMIKPKRFQPNIFCDTVKTRAATLLLSSSSEEQQAPAALDLLPQDTDLVIHLRLGDTLDQFVLLDEVEDVFQYGVSIVPIQIRTMINNHHALGWWHYVKSKCFYDNMLSELAAKNITKLTRVVIVGSALHHTRAGYNTHNSMKYSQLVKDFFVNKGYEVIQRLDGLPDDDMMYLSHASTFVAAGGGFSLLANICVQQLGGTAISHQNGLNQGLEKACATAPYPFPQLKTDYSWETQRRWSGSGGQWGATCRTFPPAPMNWTQEDTTACNPPRSV